MIGTSRAQPGVYSSGPRVEQVLRRGLARAGRRQVRDRGVGSASDHAPFRTAGIAVGGVYTGLDRCYHRRCDDRDKVDRRLIADVAEATRRTLLALAR